MGHLENASRRPHARPRLPQAVERTGHLQNRIHHHQRRHPAHRSLRPGSIAPADGIPRRIGRRRRPRLRPLRRSLGRPPAPPPHPDRYRSRPRRPAGNHSPRRCAAPPEHGAPLRGRDRHRHIHRALRRQLPGLRAVPGGPRGTCGSQQQIGAHRVHRRYHRPRPHRSPGATDHRSHGDPPRRPVVPLLRRFRLADS